HPLPTGVIDAVEPSIGHAVGLQPVQPGPRLLLHLHDRTEADRLSRTGLRTRRHQVGLQPVVAEGALECTAVTFAAIDHAEGAGGDTVPATVADVRLDDDGAELGSEDGASRADLEAGSLCAVLADVRIHQPSEVTVVLLLDERHVSPGVGAEAARVVIGVGEEVKAIVRQQVPFLAGDLAGLAADADRAVGEETYTRHEWAPCVSHLGVSHHVITHSPATACQNARWKDDDGAI